MKASQAKIGLRVRVKSNGLTAIIVSEPEYYTGKATLVRIKYEFSTRYEYQIDNQLEALPTEEQFPAHGGTFERPKGLY
tara:strand:+ start:513 stop:749 length:237 start_codon:yes stop_codon:yes gene_type:complete